MKPEEAIKMIKAAQSEVEWEYPMEYAAAFDMAISSLEKQIPKKPNYKREDRFVKNHFAVYPHCPVCEKEVVAGDMYCVQCGQPIDWG